MYLAIPSEESKYGRMSLKASDLSMSTSDMKSSRIEMLAPLWFACAMCSGEIFFA